MASTGPGADPVTGPVGARLPPSRRDEASWVAFLADLWGRPRAEVGPGDDCAVLPAARYAASTDALVEGVDFRREWGPPEALGHKALAANLSDLAACGARPRYLLLTLAIPPDLGDAFMEGVARGMRDLAVREGVDLAGGDLSASPGGLFLSLAVLGLQEAPPLLRSGGRPGDRLFVGGPLGGARAGLRLFQSGTVLEKFSTESSASRSRSLLRRFYAPPPQTHLGLFLASRALATCCIDLSDGLACDLARVCAASKCGAELLASEIPIEPGVAESSPAGSDPLEVALLGGEDQVLLFAVPSGRVAELSAAPIPVHPVGHLLPPEAGVALRMPDGAVQALPVHGYDHFA